MKNRFIKEAEDSIVNIWRHYQRYIAIENSIKWPWRILKHVLCSHHKFVLCITQMLALDNKFMITNFTYYSGHGFPNKNWHQNHSLFFFPRKERKNPTGDMPQPVQDQICRQTIKITSSSDRVFEIQVIHRNTIEELGIQSTKAFVVYATAPLPPRCYGLQLQLCWARRGSFLRPPAFCNLKINYAEASNQYSIFFFLFFFC